MLFDAMLEVERQPAHKLAYDRPSGKMLPFMAKHFGLKSYVPQTNNFVVFDEYFRTPGELQMRPDSSRNRQRSVGSYGPGGQTPHSRFHAMQERIHQTTAQTML